MNPSSAPILSLQNLGRILAGRAVVRGLDLELRRGEVLGLLGVNGAGKSTTLRMIAGVLVPTSGSVRLNGEDLYEHPELARRRIGYLPEVPPLHAELTPQEFLTFCARLRGLARSAVGVAVARAIERCELGEVRRRPIAVLSKGFRQRVGLAQAILHEPELIVLDEPASGLDPVQALKLRQFVRGLGEDHAVVLSTHALPDVSACCDRVAILHRGALRHVGTMGADTNDVLRVGVAKSLHAIDWQSLDLVVSAEPVGARQWRVRLQPGVATGAFARAMVERGFGLEELRGEDGSIERVFLSIAAMDESAAVGGPPSRIAGEGGEAATSGRRIGTADDGVRERSRQEPRA